MGDQRFAVEIPDGWQQGRGAFGGLVLATLLRAMEQVEPTAARVTRTLSGDLCGPALAGAAEVRVRVLRRGGKQTNVQAEMVQGDNLVATATAVLSEPRTVEARHSLTAPAPSRWQDAPPFPYNRAMPSFAVNYEYRSLTPAFQVTGNATQEGWVREGTALAKLDAPALIGRLDAWWPTLFAVELPRPVATIAFTAEILVDPATLPPDQPLRYRALMAAQHDGFFVELRELWHGDLPVALNQQTFAILR